MINQTSQIHSTAEVSPSAIVGAGTSVWNQTRVREGAVVGEDCIIGTGVYIDRDVVIGSSVKIENNAQLFRGVTVEDGVFIGPQTCFTNDRIPRAIDPDGYPKTDDDWTIGLILVRYGASVGARAVILPGVTIGRFAMVGAGAVVTRDVPDLGLVVGVPAELQGHVMPMRRSLIVKS